MNEIPIESVKTPPPIHIHPSSLDLNARCGASYYYSYLSYGSPPAEFGHAGHECAEKKAKMQEIDWMVIQEKYGITDHEVVDLQWMVRALSFNFHPDDAITEQRFVVPIPDTNALISCMPDLILKPNEDRPYPHLHDYKYGRLAVSVDSLQFKTYAWVITDMGKVACDVSVHQIRERKTMDIHYTAEDLAAYTETLQHYVENIKRNQYVVGTHCDTGWCPARTTCVPYKEEMCRLAPLFTMDEMTIAPASLSLFVRKMKMIEKALKRGKEIVEEYVRDNGPIDLGDGYVYKEVAGTKKVMDTGGAIAHLRGTLGDAFVFTAVTLSKTGIVEACRNKNMPWHERGLSSRVITGMEENKLFNEVPTSSIKIVKQEEENE